MFKKIAKSGLSVIIFIISSAVLTAFMFYPLGQTPAFAGPVLPTGGSFAAGGGTISSSGPSMTVNQNTARGIINWQGFSIGKGGSVFFNNGSGATLNRVTGGSLSSIAGLLKATGSLYLINPSGIVITSSGSVITGGDFIASTLNESDSDFMNSVVSLSGLTGSVANNGTINSSGNAVLVGTVAVNTGTITSSGTASLISGTQLVLIPENGPSGILISPSSVSGNVTNSGIIKAASVYLSSADGDVYALAGNNGGLIEATGAATVNGQVWLTAPKGTVSVNSPITASNPNNSGGNIFIDGLNTTIGSSSVLNASGTGGVINIGLFPSLPESLSTTLSSGAELLAGGINGGGFIDTSGDTLKLGGITVNANGGEWLLDPADFTIDSSNNSTIDTALVSGSVTITTASSGTTTSPSLTSGSYNTNTGDINVDAPLSWSNANTLTLSAYNSINVNSTITASGGGGLVLDYNTAGATQNYATDTGMLNIAMGTGSVQFTDGTTAAGGSTGAPVGSLSINGTAYTLVNDNNIDTVIDSNGDTGDYALATDITAPSSFTPIGESTAFTGTFNGLGNTVNNLTIGTSSTPSTDTYVGLFGQLGSGGIVENLGLTGGSITGGSHTGGIAGVNSGGIEYSYNTGTVTGGAGSYNGGIAGYNDGTIEYSYNTGAVSGTSNSGTGGIAGVNFGGIEYSYNTGAVSGTSSSYNGGIAGYNYGTIEYSYNTGLVSGTSSSGTGGIAGYNNAGTISDSYNTGAVSGTSSSGTGGIAGDNGGTITNSYNTGAVSGTGSYNGGIAGDNGGTISDSYNTGAVTGGTGGSYNGGIAGVNSSGTISDSYNTGAVSGSSSSRNGGIAGDNGGTITNSYNTGAVSGTGSYNGGIAGVNSSGTISDSYNTGTVTGGTGGSYNGGIAGYNDGTISDSYNTGAVSGTSSSGTGGIAGDNGGTITNSYNTGAVSGSSSSRNGGIAGYNYGTIEYSYNTGTVTGGTGGSYNGGIAGVNSSGTISDSYNTGAVSGSSSSRNGGIAGYNYVTIEYSYNTGAVSGTGSYNGGIAGQSNGTIEYSYNTGAVSGTSSSGTGGIAGYNDGNITDSYWDITNTTAGVGYQGGTGSGTGLTDSQMKQSSNFSGWSITDSGSSYAGSPTTWFIYDGDTYPLLSSFMTPLTVSAGSATETYNGIAYDSASPSELTYNPSITSSDISGHVLGTAAYTGGGTNAGQYNITLTGGLYSNQSGYIITYGSGNGTLTINPADITVTTDSPAALTYNGSAYTGAPGYTVAAGTNDTACTNGLCGSDTLAGGTYSYSQSGSSVTPVNAGSYNISLTGLSNTNYTITYDNAGILTINPIINSVYSNVFQAFWDNTLGGIAGASGSSASVLNSMLTGYEGAGLTPNIPAPWTGWHIYLRGLNGYNISGTPYGFIHKHRHNGNK